MRRSVRASANSNSHATTLLSSSSEYNADTELIDVSSARNGLIPFGTPTNGPHEYAHTQRGYPSAHSPLVLKYAL